jgi:SAM-dependent methyltransferase
MPETVNICPLCGGSKSKLFDQRKFLGCQVENRMCAGCGLVFQSPRMTKQELDNFYEAEYSQLYRGVKGILPKEVLTQHGRAAASLDCIKTLIPQVRRHLDFGCSTGIQLLDFQKKYGSDMVGVEPDPFRRSFARENGVRVYASLDEFMEVETGRFDLISMFHVLEHLVDPCEYLNLFRERCLAPDGWLLIEVPNLYAHDSFEVAHLYSFSHHTLIETIKKAGLKVCRVKLHGRPASRILPLYITLLARPLDSSKRPLEYKPIPETGVVNKRWLGMQRRRILQRLLPRLAWQELG